MLTSARQLNRRREQERKARTPERSGWHLGSGEGSPGREMPGPAARLGRRRQRLHHHVMSYPTKCLDNFTNTGKVVILLTTTKNCGKVGKVLVHE